ncbi:MAG: lipopolysaccharide biosynthesis protein, partial [Rhodospirillales bacterium]
IGFPIMTFDMASNLVRSADRFLIAGLLGTEELGYYALAAFVFASLLEIPGAAREVLEPKMMHDMSEMEPADVLRDFLFRPLCNTAHYILFLIGPAVFLLPFIELVLPRYAAGVLPAQILALGGYFLAISFVVRGVVVANDWQRRALVPIFAVGLFNVALNGAAIKLGYGIAGVAAASSLAYAVLLVWLLALVKSRHPCRTLSWMPVLSGLVLPFLFLLILLGGLWQLGEAIDVNPWAEAVLLAVLAPVLTSLYIRVAAARNPYVDAPDYGRLLRRLRRRR